MASPENAENMLVQHFRQISLEEFKDRYDKYTGADSSIQLRESSDQLPKDIILSQGQAAPLPLDGYLASALTNLSEDQREHLFAVSDVISTVCQDLAIEVYEPRKSTDPIQHADVSAEEVFNRDRERVLESDLIIHVADYASTGAGEELDFALAALIPIILVSKGDSVVSRMVLGIPALKLSVSYTTLDELRVELAQQLAQIRPILEERKMSFSKFDANIIGNRVRVLREEAQLTREELASSSKGLLTVDRLRVIEENSDKVSNPSLLELRALAALIKTTVADLTEPDFSERVSVMLQEWLDGRVAARHGMTRNDRNRIITRILLRVIDDLQRE